MRRRLIKLADGYASQEVAGCDQCGGVEVFSQQTLTLPNLQARRDASVTVKTQWEAEDMTAFQVTKVSTAQADIDVAEALITAALALVDIGDSIELE